MALAARAKAAAAEEEGPPVPGTAAADLAELVWNETCSSAERNEGCGAEDEEAPGEGCCTLEEAEARAAEATLRGHAEAAPAVTPSSSSSMVIVGGTSGRTKVPAERRGIAIPSPRKLSAEGEKAREAEREASLAREVKGRGARGMEALGVAFVEEEEDGASAEGAGRRMVAGRMKGMVVVGREAAGCWWRRARFRKRCFRR